MNDEIPENERNENSQLSSIEAEDILSYVDGIPLPPAIKKNLWKSLNRLITGLVDVPVAYLEAKVQKIKGEADGLSLVTSEAAKAASKEFGVDKELVNRSVNFFGTQLLREQINREAIMEQTIEDLKTNPPKEDIKEEIDEDWLEMFARIAATKSNKDVQLFLSKILAGEIRNPGSFGPRTIQTLSVLDKHTAEIFLNFCKISFDQPQLGRDMTCLITQPFGKPGTNALREFGLSYSNLTLLQDEGLIQNSLTSYREFNPITFSIPFCLGNEEIHLSPTNGTPKELTKVNILNFTKVGLELREVMQFEYNSTYNDRLIKWVNVQWKLDRIK